MARRGLIIRHLVLPEGGAGSGETLAWIAEQPGHGDPHFADEQYFPAHLAPRHPGSQKLTDEEYAEAVEALEDADWRTAGCRTNRRSRDLARTCRNAHEGRDIACHEDRLNEG